MEFNKYTDESLQFIFQEAEKIDNAINDTFRNINNKSYILLASLITIAGWLISLIDSNQNNAWIMVLFVVLLAYPFYILQKNLRPRTWRFPGAEPKLLMHEWFANTKQKEQHRQLLIQRIEDLQLSLVQNSQELEYSSKRLKLALLSLAAILILLLVFRLCALMA